MRKVLVIGILVAGLLWMGVYACSKSDKLDQNGSGVTSSDIQSSYGYGPVRLFKAVLLDTMPKDIRIGETVSLSFQIIPIDSYSQTYHPVIDQFRGYGVTLLDTLPMILWITCSSKGIDDTTVKYEIADVKLSIQHGDTNYLDNTVYVPTTIGDIAQGQRIIVNAVFQKPAKYVFRFSAMYRLRRPLGGTISVVEVEDMLWSDDIIVGDISKQ